MAGALEQIIPALYTKLTTVNPFNTAMGSRIYFEEYQTTDGSLPTTYPYSTFFVVNEGPEYTFNTERTELLVQIDIFGNAASASTMLTDIGKLHTLLDETVLTITGWTSVRMQREGHIPFPPDNLDIRQSSSTYRIQAQKD